MSEQLPISIKASDELACQFDKIHSVVNKLEAQFNFQTMTANWYGEEDKITFIDLQIETHEHFTEGVQNANKPIEQFSDDVFCQLKDDERRLTCVIALTKAEMNLITEQGKVLAPLLQVKVQKVLNLIAKKIKLPVF